MTHAVWTPKAESDLEEIAYYIATEDGRPQTAKRIVQEIKEKADQYSSSPELGQRNPDFPPDSLYFRHKRWAVLYITLPTGGPVSVSATGRFCGGFSRSTDNRVMLRN